MLARILEVGQLYVPGRTSAFLDFAWASTSLLAAEVVRLRRLSRLLLTLDGSGVLLMEVGCQLRACAVCRRPPLRREQILPNARRQVAPICGDGPAKRSHEFIGSHSVTTQTRAAPRAGRGSPAWLFEKVDARKHKSTKGLDNVNTVYPVIWRRRTRKLSMKRRGLDFAVKSIHPRPNDR